MESCHSQDICPICASIVPYSDDSDVITHKAYSSHVRFDSKTTSKADQPTQGPRNVQMAYSRTLEHWWSRDTLGAQTT